MTSQNTANANPQLAKYVFLDIVAYSQNRSVEAQTDLVSFLNKVVSAALSELDIPDDSRILLPTGDGICVALIGAGLSYDVHLLVALSILRGVAAHNKVTSDAMRRFDVRIGINQNVDNLVIDINNRRNVAGAGINLAQRLMNIADGNQIVVGSQVPETLSSREAYMKAFRTYSGPIKHGVRVPVH